MEAAMEMDVVPADDADTGNGRDPPSLALERTWRCVGCFCSQENPDEPYLIMISIYRDTTRNGRDHILAVRVSATCWLAPLVFSPLFEHQCILDEPVKNKPYTIESIHHFPEFSPNLFYKADAKLKKHNHSKSTQNTEYMLAKRDNLAAEVPYEALRQVYRTCFVVMGNGFIADWEQSYMSAPLKYRKVRSYAEDPIGAWQKRDELLVNKYNDELDVFGKHFICIPVTVDKLWKTTRKMYHMKDDSKIEKAARDLVIYNDAGHTGKIYTGEDWARDTRESERGSHAKPSVKIYNILLAFEEEKHRNILGAYALLCVDNSLRLWSPKAMLPDYTGGEITTASGIVPPIPWFTVETPAQATDLYKMITATDWKTLPTLPSMIRLLTRGSLHLNQSPRGACGIIDDVSSKEDRGRFCTEILAAVIGTYCVKQFELYGSTARTLDLQEVMTKPGLMTDILGHGVSLVRWLCGDCSVFTPPTPVSLATYMVTESRKLGPETNMPLFLIPLTKEQGWNPVQGALPALPIDGFLWCLRSGKIFLAEQDLIKEANAVGDRLQLLPLNITSGGGTGWLTPLVEIIRATPVTSLLVVTPYSKNRRVRHLVSLLGVRGKQKEFGLINEAVVTLSDMLKPGAPQRIFMSRVVYIDSAHLMDVGTLRQIINFATATLRCERLIISGSVRLVPMTSETAGAAFRDLVIAFPQRVPQDMRSVVENERKVSEADALALALKNWKSFSGETLLSFSEDRPTEGTYQALVPNRMKYLPRSADASKFMRTSKVIGDFRGNPRNEMEFGDVDWKYAMGWSCVSWLDRGELMTLLSLGHSLIIYRDNADARPVRSVSFPQVPYTEATAALVFAELYKAQKFGSFRTTGYELHAKVLLNNV